MYMGGGGYVYMCSGVGVYRRKVCMGGRCICGMG